RGAARIEESPGWYAADRGASKLAERDSRNTCCEEVAGRQHCRTTVVPRTDTVTHGRTQRLRFRLSLQRTRGMPLVASRAFFARRHAEQILRCAQDDGASVSVGQ